MASNTMTETPSVSVAPNGSESVTTLHDTVNPNTTAMDGTGTALASCDMHNDTHGMQPIEDQHGFVFEEQTEQMAVRFPPITEARAVNEPTWDMKSFFKIPIRITSGQWSTTQTVGTQLASFDMPYLFRGFDRWRTVFERYVYFRCRYVFRIELNGTAFHAGKLVAAVIPNNRGGIAPVPSLVTSSLLALPHVTLYPAYNNVATIETQWLSEMEHLPTIRPTQANTASFARCALMVFNQLSTGVGASTSIGYTVYCHLEDVELSIPVGVTGVAQSLFSINNITNNMGNIENSTVPTNVTGDEYDVSVGLAGLDLPADPTPPHSMVRVLTSSNFHVRGCPSVNRLSPYPESQSIASKYNFEVPHDEMSFKFLLSRWHYLSNTTLSTTNTFGQVIFTSPIGPPQPPIDGYTSPFAFVGSYFDMWRGDLVYCVEVIATQYHTAKIFCGVVYGTSPVPDFTTTGVDPSTYYGKTIEINKAKTCFEIRVPYQYVLPWCQVSRQDYASNGRVTDPIISPATGSAGFPYIMPHGSIGTFFISVLNTLVIPSNVATSINLNVYVKPGRNFGFHTLGTSSYLYIASAQANDSVGTRPDEYDVTSRSNLNERVQTLRDVIKRCVFTRRTALVELPSTNAISGAVKAVDLLDLVRTHPNFYAMCASYRAVMGDLRIKIVAELNSSQTVHVLYLPPSWQTVLNTAPSVIQAQAGSVLAAYIFRQFEPSIASTVDSSNAIWLRQAPVTPDSNNYRINVTEQQAVILGFSEVSSRTSAPQATMASQILGVTAPSCELEIPFYSPKRYITSPINTVDNPWGSLLFWSPVVPNRPDLPEPIINIFMGAGDNLRFAQFSGAFSRSELNIWPRMGSSDFLMGTANKQARPP